MPGKLYADDMARRVRESGKKLYRPSNGSEGMMFMSLWCDQCKRDEAFQKGEGDGCEILSDSMGCMVEEPGYPTEMTYDDEGQPMCSAFEPREV